MMDFREELQLKLANHYDVVNKKRIDDGFQIIHKFFQDLEQTYSEVIKYSKNEVNFYFSDRKIAFRIRNITLAFIKEAAKIKVCRIVSNGEEVDEGCMDEFKINNNGDLNSWEKLELTNGQIIDYLKRCFEKQRL